MLRDRILAHHSPGGVPVPLSASVSQGECWNRPVLVWKREGFRLTLSSREHDGEFTVFAFVREAARTGARAAVLPSAKPIAGALAVLLFCLGAVCSGANASPPAGAGHDSPLPLRFQDCCPHGPVEARDEEVDTLIVALAHPGFTVRECAARCLARTGHPRAVGALVRALEGEPQTSVHQEQFVWALGELKDRRAIVPLLEAMLQPRAPFLDAARDINPILVALGAIDPDWDQGPEAREMVPRFIAGLDADSPPLRGYATLLLGRVRAREAVEPLAAHLSDRDARVRARIAWALGEIADERSLSPLLTALGDADPGVRTNAASALGRLGNIGAASALKDLQEFDPNVRRSAVYGLERLTQARRDGDLGLELSFDAGRLVLSMTNYSGSGISVYRQCLRLDVSGRTEKIPPHPMTQPPETPQTIPAGAFSKWELDLRGDAVFPWQPGRGGTRLLGTDHWIRALYRDCSLPAKTEFPPPPSGESQSNAVRHRVPLAGADRSGASQADR